MNMERIKGYLVNALRTFIMAFLGSVVAMIPTVDFSSSKEVIGTMLYGLFASSVAAGISAVMNMKEETV